MITVKCKFLTPIPEKQIKKFMDRTVYNTARITMDLTKGMYPRKSGTLYDETLSNGVQGQNAHYGLGPDVDYAKYVWAMGQDTNWTNKATKAQWNYTVFNNKKEQIVSQAVSRAKGGL